METSKDSIDAPTTKGRFKLVGNVVMAIRRLQGERLFAMTLHRVTSKVSELANNVELAAAASLNPTYQYGKRPSDGGTVEVVSEPLRVWTARLSGLCWTSLHVGQHVCIFRRTRIKQASRIKIKTGNLPHMRATRDKGFLRYHRCACVELIAAG